MSRLLKKTLMTAWLIAASFFVACIWERSNLAPQYPDMFANWLWDRYHMPGLRTSGDLELFCMFAASFIIVSLGTALTLFIRGRIGKNGKR